VQWMHRSPLLVALRSSLLRLSIQGIGSGVVNVQSVRPAELRQEVPILKEII
jgi:hypothetical protein